jgi:hypothetical protein
VHARANTLTDSAQAELGLNKTQRGYVSLALKQWSGERAAAERASAAAALEQALERERASAAASLEQARAAAAERASAAAALEQALERERVSAAAALERERKKRFMAGITAFAGSASEASLSGHAWGADTRRGLRPAEQDCSMEQVLLRDFPHVAAATVTSAWAAFKDRARRAIKPEDVKSHERARVHPVLRVLVACAMGDDNALKCWYEGMPQDAFPSHNTAPDFSFTSRDDASLATIAVQLLLEAKQSGDYGSAMLSAANYARRTVAARVEEADARGERDLDRICTFAMGSDARTLGLVRVSSGAPADGGSFEDCRPHAMYESAPMDLLGDAFTPDSKCLVDVSRLPDAAPAGFGVLVRVLRAGGYLVSACPLMRSCDGRSLGRRLGSGGVSDVYELSDDATACVKIPRYTSSGIESNFRNEATVLTALAAKGCAHVPQLRHLGALRGTVTPTAPWPYLTLSPVGVPLAVAASARVAAGNELDAVRREFAALSARGLASALRCAHAAELVHADVRPQNMVVVGGASDERVVLVDWALAARFGENIAGIGQELYTADRVRLQKTCTADARVDLVGAAYTLLSIAYGYPPLWRAPWRTPVERADWLAHNAADPRVASTQDFINKPSARRGVDAYDELERIFA